MTYSCDASVPLVYDKTSMTMKELSLLESKAIPDIEEAAFKGNPRQAYMLGRYYEYCLDDIKTASVWYYIASCFNYRSAENRLSVIIGNLTKGKEFKYNPGILFSGEFLKELEHPPPEDGSGCIFSAFIYYQRSKFLESRIDAETFLKGKVHEKLLIPASELPRISPRVIGFDQPIEPDEIPYYKISALTGNTYSASNLFQFYRYYADKDDIEKSYISAIWLYVALAYGIEDAKFFLLSLIHI